MMFKKSIVFAIVLVLMVITFTIASENSKKADPILLSLGDKQFNEMGLNKLNKVEKGKLFKFMQPVGDYSYLEGSAVLYMESQGWQPMHVVGVYEDNHKTYNVALSNYQLILLDLFTDDELLNPGIYWVKRSIFRADVILHNGTIEDYSYEIIEQ